MTATAAKPRKKPKQPHEDFIGEAARKGIKLHRHHATNAATRFELGSIGGMTWRGEGGDASLKVDIAQRMATCWNVLEGMPTELLLTGLLRDLCQAVADGDIAKAQEHLAAMDRGTDLTNGRLHDCKACLKSAADDEEDDELLGIADSVIGPAPGVRSRKIPCDDCTGTGSNPSSSRPCTTCKGTGMVLP